MLLLNHLAWLQQEPIEIISRAIAVHHQERAHLQLELVLEILEELLHLQHKVELLAPVYLLTVRWAL